MILGAKWSLWHKIKGVWMKGACTNRLRRYAASGKLLMPCTINGLLESRVLLSMDLFFFPSCYSCARVQESRKRAWYDSKKKKKKKPQNSGLLSSHREQTTPQLCEATLNYNLPVGRRQIFIRAAPQADIPTRVVKRSVSRRMNSNSQNYKQINKEYFSTSLSFSYCNISSNIFFITV